MKLISYTNFTERKQIGVIYHFTFALEDIIPILAKWLKGSKSIAQRMNIDYDKSLFLKNPKNSFSYSFTRNKNLKLFGDIRFELDGNKMSDKYKIFPIAELGFEKDPKANLEGSEFEERLITDKPFLDIKPYLNQITILNRQSKLVDSIKKYKQYKLMFDKIQSYCNENNITLVLDV